MIFYLINLSFFIILDLFTYRIYKKSFLIDLWKISFTIFVIFSYINFQYYEKNTEIIIMLFVNYFIFLLAYKLIFLGINKTSPSLFIINQLKRKNYKIDKIKKKFLKKNFFKLRLNENFNSNLIGKNKNKIFLKKRGKFIINFFNTLQLILNIK